MTLAADGNEGLENALAMSFDLVLTDQHMPGKTGLDLIAELRGNPAYQDHADPRPDDRIRRAVQGSGAGRGRDRLDRKAARPRHADRTGRGVRRTEISA